MQNYNIEIKRTFLSFAQALFEQHPKYTWDSDVTKTKVLILDKHVINMKVIEAKRSIVLSRGSYGWRHATLGQQGHRANYTMADKALGTHPYMDLLAGSVTFNCIAQNGLVAEDMAHILFINLTGMKDQFSKNGIHQITNINIGEETILKSDSSIELVAVPIYVQFETSRALGTGVDFYSNFYIVDQNNEKYYQGVDYTIDNTGIHFHIAPSAGSTFTAYYTNAITLQSEVEPIIGTIDGSNSDFTVSEDIYTAYPLFSGIETTVSGTIGTL